MAPCPCGSKLDFMKCCKPFITGKALPKTAEQLMRSRYTAYTRVNINYIIDTMQGKSLESFNAIEAKQWAQASKWLSLKVVDKTLGSEQDEIGTVKFIASYKLDGKIHAIEENSRFQKIQGKWFYLLK